MTSKANANTDVAEAGAGASGVVTGVAQGQSTGGTFTESGHASMSDVNTQELMATVNGAFSVAVHAMRNQSDALADLKFSLKSAMDTVAILGAQSAQTSQDMIAKQAIRHTDLAIDRQWNLDETNVAAAATLGRLVERLNNPTPPTN